MRTTEQLGGAGDVALLEQLADPASTSRRLPRSCASSPRPTTSKPSSAPIRSSSATLAAASAPEVEVGADDDEARAGAVDEHLVHEVLGRLTTALLVEVQHEAAVDVPGAREQLELLLEGGEQLRRRLGPHDLRRGDGRR